MSGIEGGPDNINSIPSHLREERLEGLMGLAKEGSEHYRRLACEALKGIKVPEGVARYKMRPPHRTIRTPYGTVVTTAQTQEEIDTLAKKLNTPYGLL